MKLYLIFQNFQNGCHFEVVTHFFLLEVILEVEYAGKAHKRPLLRQSWENQDETKTEV